MLNMKAIVKKYHTLSQIDKDKALQYFFTMMMVELATMEIEKNQQFENETEEQAKARVEKMEKKLEESFSELSFSAGFTNESGKSHVGYL